MRQTIPSPERFAAFYLPIMGGEAGQPSKVDMIRKKMSLLTAALLVTSVLAGSAKAGVFSATEVQCGTATAHAVVR